MPAISPLPVGNRIFWSSPNPSSIFLWNCDKSLAFRTARHNVIRKLVTLLRVLVCAKVLLSDVRFCCIVVLVSANLLNTAGSCNYAPATLVWLCATAKVCSTLTCSLFLHKVEKSNIRNLGCISWEDEISQNKGKVRSRYVAFFDYFFIWRDYCYYCFFCTSVALALLTLWFFSSLITINCGKAKE